MKHRAFVLLVLAGLFPLTGCEQKAHTKSLRVSDDGSRLTLAAVRRNDALLYAFVWPASLPKLDTNDPSLKPGDGIHFLYTASDGLWFNREKVPIPKDSPVLALQHDGRVVPIALDQGEWKELDALSDIKNKAESIPGGRLRNKLLLPYSAPPLEK
ncbi:MAG TPA: hypothetical protein VFV83_09420 [Chthoniobacteraceae bacterium]|nr:hypothetical protein [Chthoniobacteraceae bacterium]